MITELVFRDPSQDIKVRFKTDLSPTDDGAFTVMEIIGQSDAEVELGFDFQLLNYDVQTFEAFAREHNLILERIDADGTTVLIDEDSDSSSS